MFQQLKIALKSGSFLLKHFNQWNWTPPKDLPYCESLQQKHSYEFYYQKYLDSFYYFLYKLLKYYVYMF